MHATQIWSRIAAGQSDLHPLMAEEKKRKVGQPLAFHTQKVESLISVAIHGLAVRSLYCLCVFSSGCPGCQDVHVSTTGAKLFSMDAS